MRHQETFATVPRPSMVLMGRPWLPTWWRRVLRIGLPVMCWTEMAGWKRWMSTTGALSMMRCTKRLTTASLPMIQLWTGVATQIPIQEDLTLKLWSKSGLNGVVNRCRILFTRSCWRRIVRVVRVVIASLSWAAAMGCSSFAWRRCWAPRAATLAPTSPAEPWKRCSSCNGRCHSINISTWRPNP